MNELRQFLTLINNALTIGKMTSLISNLYCRLDEELIKQGRQHYTTRRDSMVEAMSTAKLLSQHAAQAGVSGLSLSRGNSVTSSRTHSRSSVRGIQDITASGDEEKIKGKIAKSKLSPLEQSPDSDSPESERTSSRRENALRMSGDQLISSLSSVISNSEAPKSKENSPYRTKSKKSSEEVGMEMLYVPTFTNSNRLHPTMNEQVQVTLHKIEKTSKSASRKSSATSKNKQQPSVQNDKPDATTIPRHKTSSSSDMSRRSAEKGTNTNHTKVCKPGSGCRGRAIASVLQTQPTLTGYMPPQHITSYPVIYNDKISTGTVTFEQPFIEQYIPTYMRTVPRTKGRISYASQFSSTPHSNDPRINYSTVPRYSKNSTHLLNPAVRETSKRKEKLSTVPNKQEHGPKLNKSNIRIEYVGQESSEKTSCKLLNISSKASVSEKKREPTTRSKTKTHPNFPPDIRSLSESTML